MDYGTSAAGGFQYQIVYGDKFGATKVLQSTATNEAIWQSGGDYTGFPTQDETVSLVSTEIADTMNVVVSGLDSNFNALTETVTMTGTDAAVTSNTFTRVNRLYISSGASNTGVITANHSTTTANVFATIQIGQGQSQVLAFTVPNNCIGIIKTIRIGLARTGGLAGSALVSLRARQPEETGFRVKKIQNVTTSEAWYHEYYGGIRFPAKTDIKVIVETISDNASYFTGEVEYLFINQD